MTFEPEHDLRVADWWLRSADWASACQRGPQGFEAYVRFRALEPGAAEVLWLLLHDLERHTTTPDSILVAQWEGTISTSAVFWFDEETGRSVGEEIVEHFLPADVLALPRARRNDDRYVLFRGRLAELGQWPMREDYPADLRASAGFPEVVNGAMWPEDRAWFYTWDTDDDTGATLACGPGLAAVLLGDDRYTSWLVGRTDPDPRDRRHPEEG